MMGLLFRRVREFRDGDCARPAGATLTEVLMSLLIMSVGVVSIFSLFPIAILSSIKATQLTNGKILEENVVENLRVFPRLNGGFYWQAGTAYNSIVTPLYNSPPNYLVQPQFDATRSFPVPNCRFRRRTDIIGINGGGLGSYDFTVSSAVTGAQQPNWSNLTYFNTSTSTYDFYGVIDGSSSTDKIAWESVPVVLDPFGWYAPELLGVQASFGNFNGAYATSSLTFVQRPNPQLYIPAPSPATAAEDAKAMFALPDSWTVTYEGVPTGIDNTNLIVSFPSTADLSASTLGSAPAAGFPADVRLVFTSPTGTLSAARDVDLISTSSTQTSNSNTYQVNWSGSKLPPEIDSLGELGPVRLETRIYRYTCIVSIPAVRTGDPRAQVAVVFNRQFSIASEQLYSYTFGANRSLLSVDISNGSPLIAEGNYLFEAVTGTWHQILSVSVSGTTATVALLTFIPDYVQPNAAGYVMFLPGVVKVFEVGS